jgi:hypothetical protein
LRLSRSDFWTAANCSFVAMVQSIPQKRHYLWINMWKSTVAISVESTRVSVEREIL